MYNVYTSNVLFISNVQYMYIVILNLIRFIHDNIDKLSNPRVRPNITSPLPQLGQVSPIKLKRPA